MNSFRMSFWMVPGSLGAGDALFLAATMKFARMGMTRAVHRHGDRDAVERDAVKEDLHVLDRVDGDPGLAHVTLDSRMVAVIAAWGGEVEGDRDALLPAGECLAVESVGLFRLEKPAYWRIVQGRPAYIRRLDATVKGASPGSVPCGGGWRWSSAV